MASGVVFQDWFYCIRLLSYLGCSEAKWRQGFSVPGSSSSRYTGPFRAGEGKKESGNTVNPTLRPLQWKTTCFKRPHSLDRAYMSVWTKPAMTDHPSWDHVFYGGVSRQVLLYSTSYSVNKVLYSNTDTHGNSRIPRSRNVAGNFDVSAATRNCMELLNLAWQMAEKADFTWHSGNFPLSKCRIAIFWAQNSGWSVLKQSTIAVFEKKNFHFKSTKFSFLSTEFWAVYLELFLSANLHILSTEFLFLSAEFWIFSMEFAFAECGITIF